jgi:translation initiation factor 3 subunit I
MRPYMLKGHERPLTCVKFNRDSDLLFTMAKDKNPTVWRVANGERLGSFVGHAGTVWSCDISFDSSR